MISLKTYNAILAVIHFALAIGFATYFNSINKKYGNDPVRGVELSARDHAINISQTNGVTSAGWESKETSVFDIKLIQNMLVAFFFITALFHTYYFLTATENGHYTKMINNSNNWMRWVEYSITSSMMLFIIATLSGVKDVNVYYMIIASNVAMVSQGQLIEEAVRDGKPWWIPMAAGFLLLVAEFGVIIRDFQNRLKQVDSYLATLPPGVDGTSRRIPPWLNYMILILFAFFSSFGFISLYGAYSKVKYENVEKLYLLFSLLAKATLGGFLAYGTGQRQSNQNE